MSCCNTARTRIEEWYDNAMEQVRGVYKRRIQIYLFAIGLTVSLVMGADTIHMINVLSNNGVLRSAVVGDVGRATTPGGDLYIPISGASSPDAATGTGAITSTTTITVTGNTTTTVTSVTLPPYGTVVDELNSFGQLFGYDDLQQAWTKADKTEATRDSVHFWLLVWKALGLAITAFAVSFGAPFWFDVLNRLANLRAAIKPSDGTGTGNSGGRTDAGRSGRSG